MVNCDSLVRVSSDVVFPIDSDWAFQKMRGDIPQKLGFTGKGVKVGVVDSGVDVTHVYFQGMNIVQKDFVGDGVTDTRQYHPHGTHVAGTIHKLAPDAEIYSARVMGVNGAGEDSWIVNGVNWLADQGCRVLNMSLGGPVDDPHLHDAIAAFIRRGGVVCVAAGNEGPPLGTYGDDVDFPGRYEEVICVTAVDENLQHAPFASIGPEVDVAAGGVNIWSSVPVNAWSCWSGTSMSTPHVSGAVACLISAFPQADPITLKNLILQSVLTLSPNPIFGHGFFTFERVDFSGAANAH